MLHVISTAVVLLVAAGVWYRREQRIHLWLMGSAFALDVALVLYIELTRHAVETVTGPAGPLIWFHAGVATSVLALYVVQLTLGRRILAGQHVRRETHRRIAVAFCVCRLTTYLTAFIITGPPQPAVAPVYAASQVEATTALPEGQH